MAATKGGRIWNRLPQLINLARSKMQVSGGSHMLDYEPIHLHVSPAELHPLVAVQQAKQTTVLQNAPIQLGLVLDNFRFLLEQLPAIRTIEFSGKRHDPLENADLPAMIDYAYKFNGAETTLFTNGFLLDQCGTALLQSNLHTLVIRMYAHRPSEYSRLTGRPLKHYVSILEQTQRLLRQKKALNASVEVELCLMVDIHNYRHMIEMVEFAEQLGVDGVRFENYLPPNPSLPSDKTLYTSQPPVVRFLQQLQQYLVSKSRLLITLPTLLDPDMSKYRYCREPYTTVSVDAEFNISGCSRQLVFHENSGKVWDPDFFNNEMYQWLRSLFGHQPRNASTNEIPLPCRGCPRNMPVQRPSV